MVISKIEKLIHINVVFSIVLTISGLTEESVFILNGLHVNLGGDRGLGCDVVRQCHVEVADRRLRHLLAA